MEKKKVESFIIPPTYFRKNDYSIVEQKKAVENTISTTTSAPTESVPTNNPAAVAETPKKVDVETTGPKFSALSLSSIRAKKELEQNKKVIVRETVDLPTEPFTETEMLLQWTNYAKRLGDKGSKIMESLLLINDPVLNGTTISIELPNEGSKLDFEKEMNGLLGHLRGHLHNHNIKIDIIVNENVTIKRALNDQDKYNRLHEINPNIDLLRTTFGLDLNA
ncbi:DNA polymerase III subunit gamma/tau [Flavobacterium nitratireducens]|uniref:DNA polymerase III subunit gamma/tau n=1 Tax=Flavobacterium nitratireducens TaxID=992289 RepID=UPI002414E8D7|nr:DNA polymerase III subunit gamma/tau [Flavobacterium nitratireducens]